MGHLEDKLRHLSESTRLSNVEDNEVSSQEDELIDDEDEQMDKFAGETLRMDCKTEGSSLKKYLNFQFSVIWRKCEI